MTREKYLSALKNEIMALSSEEQAEALQYYSDYFDEADNDEKVISELGSPIQLAKTITEKFANAVTVIDSSDDNNKSGGEENTYFYNGLYYYFDNSDVKNLDLSFGIADVVVIKGDIYSVETRGIDKDDLNCCLHDDGTLVINNSKRIPLNFFSHNRSQGIVPRILITIPEDILINKFDLVVGAGRFRCKDSCFNCNYGNIEVGAGNLVAGNIHGGKINFRCGMGNLDFSGSVKGLCNIDCGMGNLKLDLYGNPEEYSYDLKLGLGKFEINKEKKSGFFQSLNNPNKNNHFSVNCGMGSVNIKIK